MSRFTITTEHETVFELTFQHISHPGDEENPVETQTFATEQAARAYASLHSVYVIEFARVQKLEW